MKLKNTSIVILLCLCIHTVNAQKSDFRCGLKAMPTLVWLKPDVKGLVADGAKLTFSWGFISEYYFADNYAIAGGIDLTSRGGKTTTNDTTHYEYKLKYIELPITIKMRTNEIGYMRYFGQFGFTPGLNIKAKANKKEPAKTEDDIDIKSEINSFNLGLLIGLGFEYSLGGNTSLVVSTTFNNGFLDTSKLTHKDVNNNVVNDKVISNYVALNVGVLF